MPRPVSRFVPALSLMLALLGGAPDAVAEPLVSGDVVRAWNEVALGTARAKSLSDAQAARAYAMVNVAMYDAVNGIVSRASPIDRDHALVAPGGAPSNGHLIAAAAAAAHTVLAGLFPDQIAAYDARLAADLAPLKPAGAVAAGRAWGVHVGGAVLTARVSDGSSPNETQPAGSGPGQFRAAWSGVQFRNLTPFAIADASVYVSAGPPVLTSLDYAAALAEVRLLGSSAIPDAARQATFQFWSLGGGTSQPPGAWLQVAIAVSSNPAMGIVNSTRLFALLAMAMADTVAPTYMTKFTYRFWRPATAIREADTDGNPDTDPADPSWHPRAGGIGTSPEHWSGHSSFSGSAARVLQGFFCDDAISFTLRTDSAPGGVPRTYASFSEAETEAGLSRVVGGIHFDFSNVGGIRPGRRIAEEILASKLLLKAGSTHFGSCPF
jgi:hypothetical protein